ncbi:outer membrane biogenesis protein BamB [Maioricimonas rarisocia]|uniref:Outer membrane biogenesis protein BamB n=1 Tax=Maioricimonas rarisocia TaxID=2528026 RepID=A0A517Z8A2_9PLAN|nr:PQQ-binding-like beta-propeller repeat protein [Maioricimonas rarisocia]QDU38706.1 outer membrane biogenesis protein BamB [Maioricimonas rarisocia]
MPIHSHQRSGGPSTGLGLALAIVLLVCPVAPRDRLLAQDLIGSSRIAVVDAPSDLARRLATADELAERGTWPAFVDEIMRLTADAEGQLYELTPGYYVAMTRAVQSRLATLTPEGRAAWRERVDPLADELLAQARAAGDPTLLERIVDRYFASRASGEALWLLGELAWREGDLARARQYWIRLLPAPETAGPGSELTGIVRFPDPEHSEAEILARLVLCSIMEGDLERAQREHRVLAERFPEATGWLAGREGILTTLLEEIIRDAASWSEHAATAPSGTFAGDAQRNGRIAAAVLPGELAWSLELPRPEWIVENAPDQQFEHPPALVPVASRDVIAVNTGRHVLAVDESTGEPAWPVLNVPEDAIVFPPLPSTGRRSLDRPVFSQAAVTSTIDAQGRLYAAIGLPVIAPATIALQQEDPRLICLDTANGEGRLLWSLKADELARLDGWYFTGTPVAIDDRLYVACRRSRPELECGVVCLNAGTGELVWFTRVCGLLREPLTAAHLLGHELLTVAGGQVFYTIAEGPLAALDAETGGIDWFLSQTGSGQSVSSAEARWRPPALWSDGILFAIDAAQTEVTAVHAASGTVLWSVPLDGRVSHLVGAAEGLTIVSGSQLWALDSQTGEIVWQAGSDDPTGHGFGRGTIAGADVIWPTREALWFVDVETGIPVQRLPLAARYGITGGNVSVTATHLLLTTHDRIVALPRASAQEK